MQSDNIGSLFIKLENELNSKHFILTNTQVVTIKNNLLCSKNFYNLILIFSFIIVFMFYVPDAHCAGLTNLSKNLESKIGDISKVVEGMAKAGVGLGLLWFIVSLIRGEPQYRYAFLLVLAGCLLYTASYIAKWAIGT